MRETLTNRLDHLCAVAHTVDTARRAEQLATSPDRASEEWSVDDRLPGSAGDRRTGRPRHDGAGHGSPRRGPALPRRALRTVAVRTRPRAGALHRTCLSRARRDRE